jgi:hypothetical protein
LAKISSAGWRTPCTLRLKTALKGFAQIAANLSNSVWRAEHGWARFVRTGLGFPRKAV